MRAILADSGGGFAARAITRRPDSDKARALAASGAEVVAGDADDAASLERAFAGAYGADAIFAAEGAPTSFLMAAFYWENFIHFGQGPRRADDGQLELALPFGGGKLPGIAAEDIGKCAYGIFRRGADAAGQRFGIAGEVLSRPEYAAAFSRHLGAPVRFYDMPFGEYRALGFPGADDMGNMYEHHARLGEEFRRHRSPEVARALNPALLSFDAWLGANASRIPLG